jgi:hypothetical protein
MTGTIHEDQFTYLTISLSVLLITRNVSENTRFVEKIKTRILCSITSFKNRTLYNIMWKNVVAPDRPRMTIRCMRIRAGYLRLQTHTHNM